MKKKRAFSFLLVFCILVSLLSSAAFAEEPEYEEPEYEEPAYEEPAYEEPAYEEPAYEEPAYEEPAYEEPAYEEPAYEEPAYEEPAYEEPAYEEPAYEEPAYEEPAYEESAYEEPANEEPAYEEPTYEEPAYEESEYEEPADEEPAYEEPAYEEPVYIEPAAEEPPYVVEPTAEEQAYEEPVYEEPMEEEQTYEESLYEEPETEVLDLLSEEVEDHDTETITEDSATEAVSDTENPEDAERKTENGAHVPENDEDDQEMIESVVQETSVKQEAANGLIESGTIGDNLSWRLDEAGVLTISGYGAMEDFTFTQWWNEDERIYYTSAPWWHLNDSIKNVIIKAGVTSIGDHAFFECFNLTGITIPAGVAGIGDCAFSNCYELKGITFPASVTSIGSEAFWYCGFTSVIFAGGPPSIASDAFYGVTADAYYPNDGSWGTSNRQDYGGTLAWNAYNTGVKPEIVTHPTSKTIAGGNSAVFSVEAIGNGLSYQWQVYNTATGKWVDSDIANAKTPTLSFTAGASHNDLKYRCAVKNSGGTVNSSAATLTVLSITSHPKNVTVMSGEKASFTVAATGSGLSYQWQVYNASTGKWVNSGISSAKTAALSFETNMGHNGLKYRCAVKCNGITVNSNAATLTVKAAELAITSHPKSITVTSGAKATFSVSATGNSLSYQWQVYNASTGKWVDSGISSAKTSTLSFTTNMGHNGLKYRCAVRDGGSPVYSNAATLTVTEAPVTITSQPKSVTVKSGAKVSFSISAAGNSLSYQWQVYNASTGKWVDSGISSAKTAALSFTAAASHNGLKYRCAVKSGGTTVNSSAATLTVLSITSHPKNITVANGQKASFSVSATGSSLSYQWQVYDEPTSRWENSSVSSAKTKTLNFVTSLGLGHNGLKYRCAVTCSGITVYSNVATLTVYNGGTIGDNLSWRLDEAGVLTISGYGAMEDFAFTQLWVEGEREYYTSAPWWELSDSIQNVIIKAGVTGIGDYAFYECYNLTGITIPAGVASIGDCAFTNNYKLKGITVPASVTSIGTDAFWYCGFTSVIFAGGPPSIEEDSFYGVTADAYYPNDGSWGTSDRQDYGGTLAWRAYNTGAAPKIVVQPASKTVANGNSAVFRVEATGSGLSYQWQVYNTSTGKWVDSGIASAKTATLSFTANSSHNGLKYRCEVKNSLGTVHSSAATLTVN